MNLGHPEQSIASSDCLLVCGCMFLFRFHCKFSLQVCKPPTDTTSGYQASLSRTRMALPSPREVCVLVLSLQLDRLTQSSSSLPNRCWQIHRNACGHACRFGPAYASMHSQSPIVHNQPVHHFLHSIPNFYAQRSHELRDRFRSVHSGMKLDPDSPM